MTPRELFRQQPACPGCGSLDLRHEADDRHQCRKCLWRCRIAPSGKASDWLKIGTPKKRPRPVSVR